MENLDKNTQITRFSQYIENGLFFIYFCIFLLQGYLF